MLFDLKVSRLILLLCFVMSCREQKPLNSEPSASALDRLIIGVAKPYTADSLDADSERLKTSVEAQRTLGWKIIAKVWEHVTIPLDAKRSLDMPLWQTWYDSVDLIRLFEKAMSDLKPSERRQRKKLADPTVAALEQWNARMFRNLATYTKDQHEQRLEQLQAEKLDRQSLSGLNRTIYSPAAIMRMLQDYDTIAACNKPDLDANYQAEAAGPSPDNHAPCLSQEFTPSTAIVKAFWQRSDLGDRLPVFDTDAAALQKLFAQPGATWTEDRHLSSRPLNDEVFRLRTDSGSEFDLKAMHIITKELRHWVWVTLWWSDKPGSDFAEDQPTSAAFSEPWWPHYKMCVSTFYTKPQLDLSEEFQKQHASLTAALKETQQASAKHSWCSNPYLESGPGMAKTNCIGCHQYSAPEVDDMSNPLALDPRQQRQNFPFDYLWSLPVGPESIAAYFANTLSYYDQIDFVIPSQH